MAIILLIGLYKQNKMKSIIDVVELVNVKVIDTYCTPIGNSSSKKDHSYFEFKFNDKKIRKKINSSKCHDLSINMDVSLYYYSQDNKFFLPESMKEGYYKTSIYFLGAILLIALIPYKLFFK
tara:strand:- start:113 stop:478 length:366 start_codon:yes stop_codon:yes gene_type:complete